MGHLSVVYKSAFLSLALGTSKVSRGPGEDHLKELVSKKLSRKYFCLRVSHI